MADKTRSRRQWGTVITRHTTKKQIITYQARYVNPLDHSKKVSRTFGPTTSPKHTSDLTRNTTT